MEHEPKLVKVDIVFVAKYPTVTKADMMEVNNSPLIHEYKFQLVKKLVFEIYLILPLV